MIRDELGTPVSPNVLRQVQIAEALQDEITDTIECRDGGIALDVYPHQYVWINDVDGDPIRSDDSPKIQAAWFEVRTTEGKTYRITVTEES